MLLQTLVGVAEEANEVMDGIVDVAGEEEVSGELDDTVEVAWGTPNVVTGVNCCSCDDTTAFKYLDTVAIHQLCQRS